jgi:hypothetical protein
MRGCGQGLAYAGEMGVSIVLRIEAGITIGEDHICQCRVDRVDQAVYCYARRNAM